MHRFVVHLGLIGMFGCTDGGTVNTDTGHPQDTDETDSDTDEMDSDTDEMDSDTDMSDDTDTGDTERCPDDARFAIETTHGCILGSQLGNSESYLGIPYAAPPIGDDRWAEPRPATPWDTPYDATAFGPKCVQAKNFTVGGGVAGEGEEDCLTLNVFRPENASPGDGLPILFFTHGGSYENGTGADELYTASPILAESAVVITHNYRLGPFGFMAHEDGLDGNQGIQDSLMALEWVVENAENLGADPSKVMIFGESAGAMTTCAFLVSPRTKGLFNSALLQSIGCGWLQTPKRSAEAQGGRLAEALGCTGADPLPCMRTASKQAVVDALGETEPYYAIVDGSLIPKAVGDAIYAGEFHPVPIVAGVNADEGTMFTHHWGIDSEAKLHEALQNWGRAYSIWDIATLKTLYSVDEYGDPQRAFDQFYGDLFFHCMTRYFLSNASAFTNTYAYYYTHEPSWIPYYPSLEGWGAYHSAELTFVFGTNQELLPAYEQTFSTHVSEMWHRFGSGDPRLPDGGEWPLFSESGSWLTDGGKWVDLRPDGFDTRVGVKKDRCDFIANQWWGP